MGVRLACRGPQEWRMTEQGEKQPKRRWTKPKVKEMKAGSAEDAAGFVADGFTDS